MCVCVCVCTCVEAGAAVCMQGWGGAAIPALCNHVLIIPFHVTLCVLLLPVADERFQFEVCEFIFLLSALPGKTCLFVFLMPRLV